MSTSPRGERKCLFDSKKIYSANIKHDVTSSQIAFLSLFVSLAMFLKYFMSVRIPRVPVKCMLSTL